jgi:hypothetical protein
MYARNHCALRAPTMFLVRMKSASVPKSWLWIKATTVWGLLLSKIADCGRAAFRPRNITTS